MLRATDWDLYAPLAMIMGDEAEEDVFPEDPDEKIWE